MKKIPTLSLTHGQAMHAVWNDAWGSKEPSNASKAHVKYLRRENIPNFAEVGKGINVTYNYYALMELRLALELRYQGYGIKHIGDVFEHVRKTLHAAFKRALLEDDHIADGVDGWFLHFPFEYMDIRDGEREERVMKYKMPTLLDAAGVVRELGGLGRQRNNIVLFALTQMAHEVIRKAGNAPEINRGRK